MVGADYNIHWTQFRYLFYLKHNKLGFNDVWRELTFNTTRWSTRNWVPNLEISGPRLGCQIWDYCSTLMSNVLHQWSEDTAFVQENINWIITDVLFSSTRLITTLMESLGLKWCSRLTQLMYALDNNKLWVQWLMRELEWETLWHYQWNQLPFSDPLMWEIYSRVVWYSAPRLDFRI